MHARSYTDTGPILERDFAQREFAFGQSTLFPIEMRRDARAQNRIAQKLQTLIAFERALFAFADRRRMRKRKR